MTKIFNQKNLNNFVGTPFDSRVNTYINVCLKFTLRYLQPDIVGKFTTGVVDTGGAP
jgi:hypothetical protein